MKILVCGGRNYLEYWKVHEILFDLWPDTIIQGGANGADFLAKVWSHAYEIECIQVDAEWKKFGKAAGHIRNGEMLKLKPDLVVAFPGGVGTANMIKQAKDSGVEVKEIT